MSRIAPRTEASASFETIYPRNGIRVTAVRLKELHRFIQVSGADLLLADIACVNALQTKLDIENDAGKTAYYYENKTYVPKKYQADIKIRVKDINPLASLLCLNFSLSPDVAIDGSFTSGRTAIFQAFTTFDSLQYENTLFVNSEFDLTASKISDSTSVLAMASFNSQNQSIGPNIKQKTFW